MLNVKFPLWRRIRFGVSYFASKTLRIWTDVHSPKLRMFIYELVYSLRKLRRRDDMYPDPFAIEELDTKFGRFQVRPRTADLAVVSPAYERPDRDFLVELVRDRLTGGDSVLFVDVGAGLGTYSVHLGTALRDCPKLQILAVEGTQGAFKILSANVLLNGLSKTITPVQAIVLDRPGIRVSPLSDQSVPTSTRFVLDERSAAETQTLDAVAGAAAATADVVIVKIDVEGAEAAVLAGARGLLTSGNEIYLLAEDFHQSGLVEHLRSVGASLVTKLTPYNSWWRIPSTRM